MSKTFYGKYRGIVTDNKDPLSMGRIKAKVPDVLGNDESGWAMPHAPFGGDSVGFFALPKINGRVWIEFEQGDPGYPIWSGAWWGSQSEIPAALSPTPDKIVMIITDCGHSIKIDDTPGTGGITLETAGGQRIVLNDSGIEIDNGRGASMKFTGPQVVINDGALEVM